VTGLSGAGSVHTITRVALDLYSGTGNATAAFRRAPGWLVVAVDNALTSGRHLTVLADARRLPIAGRVDFLWASPPCTDIVGR